MRVAELLQILDEANPEARVVILGHIDNGLDPYMGGDIHRVILDEDGVPAVHVTIP